MKRATAFTTMELMTVVAIIGVLTAVAIPIIAGQMPRYRLNGATRKVMGDFMWARMQAVSQKNEFKISLLSDHEYEILDDDNNNGTADTGEWTAKTDIQSQYHDVRLGLTADPVFFPRGSASPATMGLTNPGGSKDVKVHITGRVKVVE
ncbi:MAG: GspH/FimT family pseudopilin [Thermodesulfobacteriota bacterium]|nr:GspH/FimT family pseudopilin [Thermodesulfobacteriota bacterium]